MIASLISTLQAKSRAAEEEAMEEALLFTLVMAGHLAMELLAMETAQWHLMLPHLTYQVQ